MGTTVGPYRKTPPRDDYMYAGQYYPYAYAGRTFMFGAAGVAIASTCATASGLTATATPIIGVWNISKNMNLIIIRTVIQVTSVPASTTVPGSFVWVAASPSQMAPASTSIGSTPISTILPVSGQAYDDGSPAPVSAARAFAMSSALTGMTGSLTNLALPFNLTNISTAQPATATALISGPSQEDNQGEWIVQPGAFLGVMCTSTGAANVSVSPKIAWVEMPTASV